MQISIKSFLSEDPVRPGKETVLRIEKIDRAGKTRVTSKQDEVATEEPLEIRVLTQTSGSAWTKNSIAVTMRTPGNDFELASGFLFSEGVVKDHDDIVQISYCTDETETQRYNIVNVYLSQNVRFDPSKLSRHTYTSSSCGICGKGSIEQVRALCDTKPLGDFKVSPELLLSLPDKLKQAQNVFERTGGLHASALFRATGDLNMIREDVGRHNALDKVVGSLFMHRELPSSNAILLLSGRASFELVQKAALAGIPFVCAVGAPSSLAVDLARDYEMSLVGFLRGESLNVYSGSERIKS